jgi:signal transduction histidine kinase
VTRSTVAGVALAAAAAAESVTRSAVTGAEAPSAAVLCLLALGTTLPPLLLRPLGAAVVVTVCGVLSLEPFEALTAAGLVAQALVLYRLGREGAALPAVLLAVPFPLLALAAARPGGAGAGPVLVLLAALAPASALAGAAVRSREEALVHRRAREVIAATLVEHTARGERARIARELHDVVAHHISMIVVQSESARLTTPGMPAAGAERLTEIRDTARAGLTEMRRLLGVLREDADAGGGEPGGPDRHPQPGLRQLNDLLDEARATSGAGTRLIVSGAPVALDPGVELAAYRIVQEALTNARRHAPGVAVDVELQFGDDALRLRIRDNGPGPRPGADPGGHGLAGMRERAAAVGGQIHTGTATVGGFLLEATLPAKAEEPR